MLSGSALERAWRAAWPDVVARSEALVGPSLIERLAALPEADRSEILAGLTPVEYRSLLASWELFARPKQVPPPGDWWRWWLPMGGRGSGKSRTASEWVRRRVERDGAQAVGIIGPDMSHIVASQLEDPDSGLFSVFPPEQRPEWISRKDGVFAFFTGAIGYCYSAQTPEVRGPNLDTVWGDELIIWPYPDVLFDNLERALRKPTGNGARSCGVLTTTPQPIAALKRLIADPGVCAVTGSTDENTMGLDPAYLRRLDQRLVTGAIAKRERHGQMAEDDDGALWAQVDIDRTRVREMPESVRVLVCVDPAASTKKDSDETGIVVVALCDDGEYYVLEDASGRLRPEQWGARVVELYRRHRANGVLVEDNRIGDSAASTVRAAMRSKRGDVAAESLPILEIHAWRGKGSRAEPVSTLWKRGLVHVVGQLPDLEEEMTTWNPTKTAMSPNRVDAMVHGITVLAGLDDDDAPEPEDYASAKAPGRFAHDGPPERRYDPDEWEDDDDAA